MGTQKRNWLYMRVKDEQSYTIYPKRVPTYNNHTNNNNKNVLFTFIQIYKDIYVFIIDISTAAIQAITAKKKGIVRVVQVKIL